MFLKLLFAGIFIFSILSFTFYLSNSTQLKLSIFLSVRIMIPILVSAFIQILQDILFRRYRIVIIGSMVFNIITSSASLFIACYLLYILFGILGVNYYFIILFPSSFFQKLVCFLLVLLLLYLFWNNSANM